MPATLTQVVKQFQQDWTAQLEPDAIVNAIRDGFIFYGYPALVAE
jgi:hypothetical protein